MLREAKTQLEMIKNGLLPTRSLPDRLTGTLLQPNGQPAGHNQLEVSMGAGVGSAGPATATGFSDDAGAFSVVLPRGHLLGPSPLYIGLRNRPGSSRRGRGSRFCHDGNLRRNNDSPRSPEGSGSAMQVFPQPVGIVQAICYLLDRLKLVWEERLLE